jgi:hypothetical protein
MDRVDGGADILIPFSAPFFYDASAGNLLMDVRNFGGGRTSPLNANNVLGDSTSMVYSAGSVNDPTGLPHTGGLITVFDVTPLPVLTVSLQSSNLVLRWPFQQPLFEPLRFSLQQSAALDAGASWQPVGAPVTTNGSNLQVTLPLDQQVKAKFFRLIWPMPSGAGGNKSTAVPPPEY